MDFWNKRDLNGPPVLTYVTKQRMLNISNYTSHFTNAVQFTSNHGFLKQEAALLSRIIYKLKCKFSKDKFLNAMQKTNRALLLYMQLDMQTLLTMYKDSIPVRYEQETYFPTIDMLDFILVRLQGACKLLIRLRDSARTAALYLGDKLIIGHFWKIIILCLSIVSRLAQVGNQICRYFCDLYDTLLKYRIHFKNAGEKWLPDNYPFPVSMQTWLDVEFDVSATDNLQTYDLSLAENVTAYNNVSSIAIESDSDTDEVELVDEYFDLDDNIRNKKQKSNPNQEPGFSKSAAPQSRKTAGNVFVLDSDEDEYDRFGVEVDSFGNSLHSETENTRAHGDLKETNKASSKSDECFEDVFPTVSSAYKGYRVQQNPTLTKILGKIFQNQNSIPKKAPNTLKKHLDVTTPAPLKHKSQKQTKQIRNVYLNLDSKPAFYDFLNKQQIMLKSDNKSCLFSHLSRQQFVKFRKQIHYLLHIVHMPQEKVYEQCREIIFENLNKNSKIGK